MKWKVINFIETTKHKFWVAWYLLGVCRALLWRAIVHDLSKYGPAEAPYFEKALPKLKNLDYGSDEYMAAIASLGPALKHHYLRNSHHPEHWPNGFYDMSGLDVLEMLCDWKAAGRRHQTGDMRKSLEINAKRFDIEHAWMETLIQDAEEIGLI